MFTLNGTETMENDYDSALGDNPTCDICGKYIVLGDNVMQTFIGEAIHTDSTEQELGIKRGNYHLVHTSCNRKAN